MHIDKHFNRKIRLLRLLSVFHAYHCYTMMELYRKSLQYDKTWKDAEQMCDFMSVLAPYKEHSPTDFLRDKDKDSDTVLDYYNDFKKWVQVAEKVDISEKVLTAFCKNADNGQSVYILKAFGHVFYPEWLTGLFLYVNDSISKTELQNIFVEYSLFTGKPKPANLTHFANTVWEVEKMIFEIAKKQINRKIKRNLDKWNTS